MGALPTAGCSFTPGPRGTPEPALLCPFAKSCQAPFLAPSVFNFYRPDYAPPGFAERGLVAPEAQLATAPLQVGYLNGMSSLAHYGLTSCASGFGTRGSCGGPAQVGPGAVAGRLGRRSLPSARRSGAPGASVCA